MLPSCEGVTWYSMGNQWGNSNKQADGSPGDALTVEHGWYQGCYGTGE